MNNCNFCHKKGLLIYPVRYAVASPYGADGVPGLSGNFRIEDAPQAAGAAKYTLRALRPGYLYTYDERRQRLKAYVVLPTGHLWNYPLEYNAPHPSTIRFACIEASEVVRAYCVDIEHTDADPFDEPSGSTPVGWAETVHSMGRNEYPEGDKKEMENWSGEKDPVANALLWAKDIPPSIPQPTKAPHERRTR